MGWILPFQQGLGSNLSLLFRGVFLSLVCFFCIVVTKLDAEPFRWIKPILLLSVGFSELFRLLGFLNSAVNGMLNQSNMSIRTLYFLIYPYLILLTTDITLMALGSVIIIFNIVDALKRA